MRKSRKETTEETTETVEEKPDAPEPMTSPNRRTGQEEDGDK